jgi:hypothetical protein
MRHAAAASMLALACALPGAQPAQAQFVCGAAGTYPVVAGSVTVSGGGASAGGAATACGNNAEAAGVGVTVFGDFAGFNSAASNVDNAVFGGGSGQSVTGSDNAAFGQSAGSFVTGGNNSAYGANSGRFVTGAGNVAFGSNAGSGTAANSLTVSNTVAIGNGAIANADGGVAIGNGASTAAGATNAVAIGSGAQATFANSTAIGSGAAATHANQQMFGTASNTYTTPGITSSASRAAQSGPTQIVTSDAGGNLATNTAAGLGLATTSDIAGVNSQIAGINTRLNDIQTEERRGVAMAMAMAVAMTPSAPGKTTVSMNSGFFDGETGLGIALAHRLTTAMPIVIHGSYGNAGSQHGGRVGMAFEF